MCCLPLVPNDQTLYRWASGYYDEVTGVRRSQKDMNIEKVLLNKLETEAEGLKRRNHSECLAYDCAHFV